MNSIVIGANGFLGSKLVNMLIDKGHVVTSVFNQNRDKSNPAAIPVSFNEIKNLTPEDFDFVFYVSGSFSSSYNDLIKINCLDLKIVSDYFNSAKLIYVSSINVYGENDFILNEKTAFNNPNTYGLSKIAGEFIVKNHPKYAIVRPCYLYGPKLDNKSFLPSLINQAKDKGEITIFGAGKREQDYLYVDDAAELCYLAALYSDNDTFLAATGKSYENVFMANLIKQYATNIKIASTGEEFGKSIYLNPIETFNKLNWSPKTSISDGIKKMWDASFN